jgi:hypothetical protein
MLVSSTRFTAVAVVALLSASALTGCSALSGSTPTSGPSLADTKSPVQLLRNSAASRIPENLIEELLLTTDESTACVTSETDPEGHIRSWRSTVRFSLWSTVDVDDAINDLAATFVEQGWDQGIYGTAAIIELSRGASGTLIHISHKPADPETGAGPEVQLQVTGPCVMTEGETSSEVTMLEAAG